MTTTAGRTGSALGDFEQLAAAADVSRHTGLARVVDPALREVLERFDQVGLSKPLSRSLVSLGSLELALGATPAARAALAKIAADIAAREPEQGPTWGEASQAPAGDDLIGDGGAPTAEESRRLMAMAKAATEMYDTITVYDHGVVIQARVRYSVDGPTPSFELFVPFPDGVDSEEAVVEPVADADADVVTTVHRLETLLGFPVREVLKAAGIRRSTFYNWKKPHKVQPRLHSVGRLWALAQCVEDLREAIPGPLRAWLLADEGERRRLLVDGEFDTLLEVAVAPLRTPAQSAASVRAKAAAVGPDAGEPLFTTPAVDEVEVSRTPRRTATVPVATRRKAAGRDA